MIDDGEWNEARTANARVFHWYGNGITSVNEVVMILEESFNFIGIVLLKGGARSHHRFVFLNNCSVLNLEISTYQSDLNIKHCVIKRYTCSFSGFEETIVYNSVIYYFSSNTKTCTFINCIIFDYLGVFDGDYNNFCSKDIDSSQGIHSINNTTTGQTFSDYFNHYDPNNWENCDFTAKLGSANIGAGTKGGTIGLNQGYPCRVNNTVDDIFSTAGGAELRSVHYNTIHNGYVLSHKDEVCMGATSNTFTLSNNAETIDDYYNGLFIFITSGDGSGETHYITDYDGATRTAIIEDTFTTVPNTSSVYSLSGTITSAVKDFGKAIKIKRNWTFQDVFANDNGEWAELLTHINKDGEIAKISSFKYKYSVDGSLWRDSDDLVSATDGENKTKDYNIGDCSEDYNEALAKPTVMRYVQFFIHIGINN